MRIVYSRHAKNRMRRDNISNAMVEWILAAPDSVTPSKQGRANAWKLTPDGWCRATFIDEQGQRVIVTVTRRRRGPAS
jgi:hypothetical protein